MTSNNSRILLVDSDARGRGVLADNLISDGYDVLQSATVVGARRALDANVIDLAIIECCLPDGDGLTLLSVIRQADRLASRIDADLPVLVLAGRASELERVRYLERGCDDFVSKPYGYVELRARINALLRRRSRGFATARLRVGPLEVDTMGRRAWVDGRHVPLSGKEFALLRVLASDPGRAFTRQELFELVWGWAPAGGSSGSRTLDTHASRLRRKLAADGLNLVVNVWGIGYRLTDPGGDDSDGQEGSRGMGDLVAIGSSHAWRARR